MVQDKSSPNRQKTSGSPTQRELSCLISHVQTSAHAQDAPPASGQQSSRPKFSSIADGTLADFSNALTVSGARLQETAQNALDLLALSGHASSRGDTADDLKMAVIIHLHLVQEFNVRVRSAQCTCEFSTCARTSFDAYDSAAAHTGDAPCAISVRPAEPCREDLQRAHRLLGIQGELDEALKNPALSIAIKRVARKPLFRPAPSRSTQLPSRPIPASGDFKRFAANDRD